MVALQGFHMFGFNTTISTSIVVTLEYLLPNDAPIFDVFFVEFYVALVGTIEPSSLWKNLTTIYADQLPFGVVGLVST